MNAIQLTQSTFVIKSANLRHYLDERGEPWFIAKDVCDYLGLTNTADTMTRVWDDNKSKDTVNLSNSTPRISSGYTKSVDEPLSTSTDDYQRTVWVVNEPGLYQLIFQSRKPEAVAFQRWVFNELLPSLRRNGIYRLGGPTPMPLAVGQTPGGKSTHGRQPFLDVLRERRVSAAVALEAMNALPLDVPLIKRTNYNNQTYGGCCVTEALAVRASTWLGVPVEQLFTASARAKLR